MYSFDTFKGTTASYDIWLDMNEPSVFYEEQGTFPMQNIHKRTDGTMIMHRDVHNAYGSMLHKTTREALLVRN